MKNLKKGIRCLFLVLGVFGFYIFLRPLWRYGVWNLGNATGVVVAGMLVLYGLYQPRIHKLCGQLWKKSFGKWIFLAVGCMVAVIVALTVIISGFMYSAIEKTPEENATVVVLGCKVKGEKPSLMLTERLEQAYAYLTSHDQSFCVLSGGKGDDEDISEAECMYRYLVEKGIDPKRLYREERSTSTRENLQFSLEIIQEQGWNQNLAIVTNEFHQYRAGKIAQNLQLSYGAVSAKTAWWLFPTFYVRELYGILYQWLL